MNDLWTSAGTWMLHTAIGGGLLLLVTCALMRWTRQPVRRQRLGDWGLMAALLVALLAAVTPAWLVISWNRGQPLPAPADPIGNVAFAEVSFPPAIDFQVEQWPRKLRRNLDAEWPAVLAPKLAENRAHAAAMTALDDLSNWTEQVGATLILAAAGVAGIFALRLLTGYLALLRLLVRSETPPPEVRGLFEKMAAGTRWARLLVSRRVLVPLSCGLLRPTVVLPASMCQESAPRQLRWIFAHELTHLRRRDAWSALLFNIGQIVFFAVPWFWWLRRQVRLCQEFVADAAAAAQDEGNVDYAEFLLSLANAPAVPVGASAVSGNCSDLFRRVTMLLKDPLRVETRCPRLWNLMVGGGLLALAVLVSGFGCRAEAAPDPDDTIFIIIRTDGTKASTEQYQPLILGTPKEGDILFLMKDGDKFLFKLPKDLPGGKDALEFKGDQIKLKIKMPGNVMAMVQKSADLAPLHEALNRLEQLKKEGKLTDERIQAEIAKALQQSRAKAALAVPMEIMNKIVLPPQKIEKKQVELKLHLDKIDPDLEKLLEQLKAKLIRVEKGEGKVELKLKLDNLDQDLFELLFKQFKAKQIEGLPQGKIEFAPKLKDMKEKKTPKDASATEVTHELWLKQLAVPKSETGDADAKKAAEAAHEMILKHLVESQKDAAAAALKKALAANRDAAAVEAKKAAEVADPAKAQVKPPEATKAVSQGRLGITVEAINPRLAEHLNLPEGAGVLVVNVAGDSPGAKAGVKANDVLVKIGGKIVPVSAETFYKFAASLKAETPLEVVVIRKGKMETLGSVTLPVAIITKVDGGKITYFKNKAKTGKQDDKNAVTTTVTRTGDVSTIIHNEGNLTISVSCIVKDGTVFVGTIAINDGKTSQTFTGLGDVPEVHRARIQQLVEAVGRLGEPGPNK